MTHAASLERLLFHREILGGTFLEAARLVSKPLSRKGISRQ
jgi:hypothetical protein